MKHLILSLISVLVFLIILSFPVFGATYTAYASVTSSTSNISMLIETMYNQSDFSPFEDWIGIRTGQYDYSVFYNISDGKCVRLRYYGVTSGYNTEWSLSKSSDNNFSYNKDGYTIVGNTEDSLGVSSYRSIYYQNILNICIPAILIIISFFVFRIRKRSRGISL